MIFVRKFRTETTLAQVRAGSNCLEFTALGRGLIAMRSLATSDNVVYDVPYSPRYPKNSDKCQS